MWNNVRKFGKVKGARGKHMNSRYYSQSANILWKLKIEKETIVLTTEKESEDWDETEGM